MLLSDLSSRFINLPPAEVDREIEDALRRVCELIDVDLSVLWQWSGATPDVIRATHVYYAQGAMESPEPMSHEHYPWYRQELLAGRTVAVSSIDELPEEAAVDREYGRRLGIQSNLCLPLSVGGERPVGALAFNTLRARRDWPDSLLKRLQLVAQVFTNALVRRRHELTLRESEQRLALAADSAGAGLWTLDFSTGAFWSTERGRAIFGYSPGEAINMERFEASVHPGDWDLVRGAIERSASTGEPIDVEYRVIHPTDGHVRWVVSRGRTQFTSTGEPERLMGVSIDISERKLAEEALREGEAPLEAGAGDAVSFSGLIVYRFGAPLYFANATLVLDEIEQLVEQAPTPVRWFVLDAEAMVDVDTTGAEVLRQAITMLTGRDVTFAVSRADRAFRSWLEKYELMELIDQKRFYPTNRHAAAAFREDPEKAM